MGLSLLFSHWAFPDLSNYKDYHALDQSAFRKICHRFSLVRRDLEKALMDQVKLAFLDLCLLDADAFLTSFIALMVVLSLLSLSL